MKLTPFGKLFIVLVAVGVILTLRIITPLAWLVA